jgi:hypothetical protein
MNKRDVGLYGFDSILLSFLLYVSAHKKPSSGADLKTYIREKYFKRKAVNKNY